MKAQFRDFLFIFLFGTLLIILLRLFTAFALVGELGDLDYGGLLNDWLHTWVCGVLRRRLLQHRCGLLCCAVITFL